MSAPSWMHTVGWALLTLGAAGLLWAGYMYEVERRGAQAAILALGSVIVLSQGWRLGRWARRLDEAG